MKWILPVLGAVLATSLTIFGVIAACSNFQLLPNGGSEPPASGFALTQMDIKADPVARRGGRETDKMRYNCDKVKCIALTFDDGPIKGHTASVLKTLKKYKARATFFVLGEMVKQEPGLLKRTVAEGHEIGNHTWSHPQLTTLPAKKIRQQIQKTNDIIRKVAGVTPVLLRPPYGATNKKEIKVAKSFGMPQINWTIDPQDWRGGGGVAGKVTSQAGAGTVVLLHDIHKGTARALPKIMAYFAKRKYKFVTVSEIMAGTTAFRAGMEFKERPEPPEPRLAGDDFFVP